MHCKLNKFNLKNISIFLFSLIVASASLGMDWEPMPEGDVSVDHRDCFRDEFNLTETQIVEMQLVSESFYLAKREREELVGVDFSPSKKISLDTYLNPGLVQEFIALGGSTPKARTSIQRGLEICDEQILNLDMCPLDGPVLSPAVFATKNLSRTDLNRARKSNAVRSLLPHFFEEPIQEITPEELALRKGEREDGIREHLAFMLTREDKDLRSFLTTGLQEEENIWQTHLSYIEARKTGCDNKTGKKMKRSEVEKSFLSSVVPNNYSTFVWNGYHVYVSRTTLNLNMENEDGETNLELLQKGLCPIGPDGKVMNVHHLTHHDKASHSTDYCLVVLLTHNLHKKWDRQLHFSKNSFHKFPAPLERDKFNEKRESILKEIAKRYAQP